MTGDIFSIHSGIESLENIKSAKHVFNHLTSFCFGFWLQFLVCFVKRDEILSLSPSPSLSTSLSNIAIYIYGDDLMIFELTANLKAGRFPFFTEKKTKFAQKFFWSEEDGKKRIRMECQTKNNKSRNIWNNYGKMNLEKCFERSFFCSLWW